MDLTLRTVREEDASRLLEIYAPYVENTAITFEYDVPTVEEFQGRIRNTLERYPYIVAVTDHRIVGYAYASAFKERAAYDWAVEMTVYVDAAFKRSGVGRTLYEELERILARQNIINVNACIAYTDTEDEHLTNDSTRFHEHMGYRKVAHFVNCGYKFNTWYDMVWLEKHLGEYPEHPAAVIPFSELK